MVFLLTISIIPTWVQGLSLELMGYVQRDASNQDTEKSNTLYNTTDAYISNATLNVLLLSTKVWHIFGIFFTIQMCMRLNALWLPSQHAW